MKHVKTAFYNFPKALQTNKQNHAMMESSSWIVELWLSNLHDSTRKWVPIWFSQPKDK